MPRSSATTVTLASGRPACAGRRSQMWSPRSYEARGGHRGVLQGEHRERVLSGRRPDGDVPPSAWFGSSADDDVATGVEAERADPAADQRIGRSLSGPALNDAVGVQSAARVVAVERPTGCGSRVVGQGQHFDHLRTRHQLLAAVDPTELAVDPVGTEPAVGGVQQGERGLNRGGRPWRDRLHEHRSTSECPSSCEGIAPVSRAGRWRTGRTGRSRRTCRSLPTPCRCWPTASGAPRRAAWGQRGWRSGCCVRHGSASGAP